MEEKKNQDPAPEQGEKQPTPSAWLQKVAELSTAITDELDESKDTKRAYVLIAVDLNGEHAASMIGAAGGNDALAFGMAGLLTDPRMGRHIAEGAQVLAKAAARRGKSTIVIDCRSNKEDDDEGAAE